ncbi:hypothetical protein SprV_0702364500 [Sparganum proliferum]
MQASTRLSTTTAHDLLFADDHELDAETEAGMQRSVELIVSDCANFGLIINTDKTAVMHQSSPNGADSAPRIDVNGIQLKTHAGVRTDLVGRHQLRSSSYFVRMDDQRLPKQLFYGDVATGARGHGGQIRRYKDTLEDSLKRLQINARRPSKTRAAIYEANRIGLPKPKRKLAGLWCPLTSKTNHQALLTCPRYLRTFCARVSLIGPLRTQRTTPTTPIAVFPAATAPASTASALTSDAQNPRALSPSTIAISITLATTSAAVTTFTTAPIPTTEQNSPDDPPAITPTYSDVDSVLTCPHCDRTYTSCVGLVDHLRIHRTETGTPVPASPTYTWRIPFHCPHSPNTLFRARAQAYLVTYASTTAGVAAVSTYLAHPPSLPSPV